MIRQFPLILLCLVRFFLTSQPTSAWIMNAPKQQPSSQHVTSTSLQASSSPSSGGDIYVLKKKRPGCTGMFWRPDPSGQIPLASASENWPRDLAKLRGYVVEYKGEKWLQATQVQQEKNLFQSGEWKDAPKGAFMPFEYDNHYYLEKV